MISKTLGKHIKREIFSTLNRFIAIFAITALGAGFYAGLRAAPGDMRETADTYYTGQSLADFRLVSTMGFTEGDVDALRAMDGVAAVAAGYSLDVLIEAPDGVEAVRLHSLPDNRGEDNDEYLSRVVLVEGRLPEAPGEVAVDSQSRFAIGDTVQGSAKNEDNTLDLLVGDSFTVVGRVDSPSYITFSRGNTNIGSGSLAAFLYLSIDAFDSEYYTELLLTLDGTEGLSAFSEGYAELAGWTDVTLEAFGRTRAEIRFNEIYTEAREAIDEAKQELADAREEAEKELADALQEIKDGDAALEDARQEMEDGRQEIADAKTELTNGAAQLAEGETELAAVRAQLESGQVAYDAGVAEFTAQKQTYDEAVAQYEAGLEKYETGFAAYESGLLDYNTGKAAYDKAYAEYTVGRAAYDVGIESLADLQAAVGGLNEASAALTGLLEVMALTGTPEAEQAEVVFRDTAASAATGLRSLAAGLGTAGMGDGSEGLRTAADGIETALAYGLYAAIPGIIDAATGGVQPALAAAKAELDETAPVLDAAAAELAAAKAELDAARTELDRAKTELDAAKEELDSAATQLDEGRLAMDEGWRQLNEAGAALGPGWAALAEAEAQLAEARAELDSGWREIVDAEAEITDGETELAEAETELAEGKEAYEEGKQEAERGFAVAETEIADAEAQLEDFEEPVWYVYGRDANAGYTGLVSNADRIGAIATVIPYFFFLVAALVCLTTMTRMVEEQRTGIGTLKALGFGKSAIAFKFLLYAALASLLGGVLGVAVGLRLFPSVIWNAYQMMYVMPDIVYLSQPALVVQSVLAMVCVTAAATLFSCIGTLRSVPAELMRPRPPRSGTRVLLERVGFIWNHLKFSHKVTVRNLFRYKKRFFMTVVGIAGCTALLVTGFGLYDSISGIVDKQYGVTGVNDYDLTIALDDPSTAGADTPLNEELDTLGTALYYAQFSVDAKGSGGNNSGMTTYLFVPESEEAFGEFVTLRERKSGRGVGFPTEGVVVTEKLAGQLGASAGDTISINRANEQPVEVEVTGVTENYVYNYIYMSRETYASVFGGQPEYEMVWARLTDEAANPAAVLEQLIDTDNVAGGVDIGELRAEINDMMESLNSVIWLILVCAGLLAFVVLYNLTNINITERQRELATLRVLGFHNREVASYVYRENLLLTLIGIAAGLVLGIFLHRYVIITAEIDEVMFGRAIGWLSYVLSVIFTLVCAGLVNLVMLRRLKKIDMVESLKSAE